MISEDDEIRIAALAEFAVLARTPVRRNAHTDVIHVADTEGVARVAQQLIGIAKGSAQLAGRSVITPADMNLARRAALGGIPEARWTVIQALYRGNQLNIDSSKTSYTLRELRALGLVQGGELTAEVNGLLAIGGSS
jgi:hypothetical protein